MSNYDKESYASVSTVRQTEIVQTKKNMPDKPPESSEKKPEESKNHKKTSFTDKFKNMLGSGKLGSVKGAKLIIPITLLVVLLLAYLNFGSIFSSSVPSSGTSSGNGSVSFTSGLDYINQIEKKLKSVLSSIDGAGKTQVMISIDSSPELVIASNVEEKTVTTSSGTTVTVTTKPIVVNNSPLVVTENLPKIKGVVVVCEGAKNIKVKLDIIAAVKALLDIPSSSIEVFNGI